MEMTLELAIKLRDYYVEHTEVAKGITDMDECLYYLCNKALKYGICWVSRSIFDCNIAKSNFSVKVRVWGVWAAKPPFFCSTQPEIIASLQYRINLLNAFINDNE